MSNYLSGSNNRGEFGSGTPRLSKKDTAMMQQQLQSAVPQIESIPSVKVIECASDKADRRVSNTEWVNSLSEPLMVERGSALTVNASFLQSRGIQNDLIDFNKSGKNRNDSTLMDFTYYTVNDGTNDKKTDVDLNTYFQGSTDVGYTYKKSLLYRWGQTMNEYSTQIGGDGVGIKKVDTIGRGIIDTGKPSKKLLDHPYIECAGRVGVKEDQNAPGYFYNKEVNGKSVLFQQNGLSWYQNKTNPQNSNPVKQAFFIFGFVPNYSAFSGQANFGDDGDRSFMLSLRQGIVDIGYEYNTYFPGRPLAPQTIRKYPCGYLASSGTNIHIEICPDDSDVGNVAKLTSANIQELKSFYKDRASEIGGTYMIYKTVKLNEPEKKYLLDNYPALYTQEELDNANFYLFDGTRGNYLRPNGYNIGNTNQAYYYVGASNDGTFKTSGSASINMSIRINQSYYYLTSPDGANGSRIGYWNKKYSNTKPFQPYIHEYTFPQSFLNQDSSTGGNTQLYRYFGNTNSPEDQYDKQEFGNPIAMIQTKYSQYPPFCLSKLIAVNSYCILLADGVEVSIETISPSKIAFSFAVFEFIEHIFPCNNNANLTLSVVVKSNSISILCL